MNRPSQAKGDDSSSRGVGAFHLLSGLSGGSLLVFGIGSVLIALVFWSPSGLSVGAALTAHGWLEMRWRRQAARTNLPRFARWMSWNQLVLAVSLSAYFGYQAQVANPETVRAALRHETVQAAMAYYPPEVAAELEAMLPSYVRTVYWLMLAAVWAGCALMAAFYWSQSRRMQCPKRALKSSGRAPG